MATVASRWIRPAPSPPTASHGKTEYNGGHDALLRSSGSPPLLRVKPEPRRDHPLWGLAGRRRGSVPPYLRTSAPPHLRTSAPSSRRDESCAKHSALARRFILR